MKLVKQKSFDTVLEFAQYIKNKDNEKLSTLSRELSWSNDLAILSRGGDAK